MNNASSHATTYQLIFFAALMVMLWHTEILFNGTSLKQKWKHSFLNIRFLITAALVQLPLSLIVIKMSDLTEVNLWGVFNHLPSISSFSLKFLIGFLMLDFCEYVYHYTMHKLSFLWKLHLIHHTDTTFDVSTTVREHPGETFVRVSYMVFVVFITGVPIEILLIRQFIQSFANVTAHTSISLPVKMEKWLSYIFITPGLHKVHHHDKMPYTDSNYGDVLCIWDRLFGTYRKLERSKINFGVDTVNDDDIITFSQLIKYPFLQKDENLVVVNPIGQVFENIPQTFNKPLTEKNY